MLIITSVGWFLIFRRLVGSRFFFFNGKPSCSRFREFFQNFKTTQLHVHNGVGFRPFGWAGNWGDDNFFGGVPNVSKEFVMGKSKYLFQNKTKTKLWVQPPTD